MVLCQLKLDTLEPGKRGVKDPAPLYMPDACFKRPFRGPYAGRRQKGPRAVKTFHGVIKAPVPLAYEIMAGYLNVLHLDKAVRNPFPAHLPAGAYSNSRHILYRKIAEGQPPVSGARVGLHNRHITASVFFGFPHTAYVGL